MKDYNIGTASVDLPIVVYSDETLEMAIDGFLATSADDQAEIEAEPTGENSDGGGHPVVRFSGPRPLIEALATAYASEGCPIEESGETCELPHDRPLPLTPAFPLNACLNHGLAFDTTNELMDHILRVHV